MARDNPAWGAERIRGELLKLGTAVSKASVQRYRRRRPTCPPSQSWRTFLRNHRSRIWVAAQLTVQTLAFRTLYVVVFVGHARRELVHLNVTASPTAAWVWRQLIAATPWGGAPRDLVRDRDAAYEREFVRRARGLGIETLLTPVRAPRANAVAERLVGTLRRECVDHCGRGERAAPPSHPDRVRPLVQPGATAPHPAAPDAGADRPLDDRLDPSPPRARRAASRVRASRVTLRPEYAAPTAGPLWCIRVKSGGDQHPPTRSAR
jgi:transposase InsO family protein